LVEKILFEGSGCTWNGCSQGHTLPARGGRNDSSNQVRGGKDSNIEKLRIENQRIKQA